MDQEKLERINRFLDDHSGNRVKCVMCPRGCAIDRHHELGECQEPFHPRISSANLHTGEEPPLSGHKGSGTIFLSGCNLHCAFCQNYPISQLHQANKETDPEGLAEMMLKLQKRGAHNINFVTPSHYVYQIVQALKIAVEKGLTLPIVYNTSGYDSLSIIRGLEGIVDVYLPDAKYSDDSTAKKLSDADGYVGINRKVLKEMYRQMGDEVILDEKGIAKRGLIIRHLILPNHTENSKNVLKWIAEELSADVHLSIMSQYFPAYRADVQSQFRSIRHVLTHHEYDEVMDYAETLGLENGWFQPFHALNDYHSPRDI